MKWEELRWNKLTDVVKKDLERSDLVKLLTIPGDARREEQKIAIFRTIAPIPQCLIVYNYAQYAVVNDKKQAEETVAEYEREYERKFK